MCYRKCVVWIDLLKYIIVIKTTASLTLWVPREVYIRHERLSSMPLWRIYTSWIPFWVSAMKIFFTIPAPMRILVKKLKSTIYNIIMFINLYKLFWKKLFVPKYIIYNLGFTESQSECGMSWNMVQSTILDDLDSFCNDNEILSGLCFCNKQHISFMVFLCSCWVVLLKGNAALLIDQTLNLLVFGVPLLAFHESLLI